MRNEPPTRKAVRLMIARQIALTHGYVWQHHPNAQQLKKQRGYEVAAENAIATMERFASIKWHET